MYIFLVGSFKKLNFFEKGKGIHSRQQLLRLSTWPPFFPENQVIFEKASGSGMQRQVENFLDSK